MTQLTTKYKTWGRSVRRYIDSYYQVEEIFVDAGGYSSVHQHTRKSNRFLIVSGALRINRYDRNLKLSYSEVIDPQGVCIVQPLIRHQFVAETEVHAYELYEDPTGRLDAEDITRFTQNGVGTYVKLSVETEPKEQVEFCGICSKRLEGLSGEGTIHHNGAMRMVCGRCLSLINESGSMG